jgi:imidazole glycerol-phosphate synthase subunit HisH
MSIVIVDYGMGNLGSIKNMLKYIGVDSVISCDNEQILNASKLILPGVGSFDSAMKNIKKKKILKSLNHKALNDKIPILGICLGMQILTNSSEEGVEKGLGWINAKTIKFNIDTSKYKIPHMGWNTVDVNHNNLLSIGFTNETRFYFVHSYYVKVENDINSILKTEHAIKFDSAINNDNIFGVQFHPEKSHKNGMQLLKNFSNI